MTWKEIEAQGRAARHKTSRKELDDLREAAERNLRDAALPNLSADNSFGMAYEGALLISKIAIACVGYRVKGPGAHQTTFLGLELALGENASDASKYFERCRRKRNDLSYERAGIVSALEAEEILREAALLRDQVEAWISEHHPGLAKS